MKSYFVDSFTLQPFKGNPAGVCFPEAPVSEALMLNVAKEFGFSETAFVRSTTQPGIYHIRYFSPKKEIPLCGHATLAAARILFDQTDLHVLFFITVENLELKVERAGEKISMAFPVYQLEAQSSIPKEMTDALGISQIKHAGFSAKSKIILLEIDSSLELSKLRPDFGALLKSYSNINGVLVTAVSEEPGYDYHYRYFWPWAGTEEDPVTGGVQTFLAKYWSDKLGKTRMRAFQSSERTGAMEVEIDSDHVLIFGDAVVILEGNLNPVIF